MVSPSLKLPEAPVCLSVQGVGVQNRAADHPSGHVEWSPPLTEKCKGHTRHKSPKCHCECAGHQQVAGGSLSRVLSSTNGSCDIYWHPRVGADIEHLHGSIYHHDQELGIDWVPALKETSLVCHSAPVQEGL